MRILIILITNKNWNLQFLHRIEIENIYWFSGELYYSRRITLEKIFAFGKDFNNVNSKNVYPKYKKAYFDMCCVYSYTYINFT